MRVARSCVSFSYIFRKFCHGEGTSRWCFEVRDWSNDRSEPRAASPRVDTPVALGANSVLSAQDQAAHAGADDLICTTPRLCQNNMTPVALRGRGTTRTYNCFPATGLYFKSKVLASVGRGSTETTRLQHGSSMFGDTHAKGGGGGGI